MTTAIATENFKKALGLLSKTTTLYVNHIVSLSDKVPASISVIFGLIGRKRNLPFGPFPLKWLPASLGSFLKIRLDFLSILPTINPST